MSSFRHVARCIGLMVTTLTVQAFACVDSDAGGGHGQCLQSHDEIFETNNMGLIIQSPVVAR